ncbi:putative killer cell immunoglobulin-like receptor like protein KIR3DP1 [Vicugna pacos]|uniref:Killer cell immunoglobulin-like receptor like protein KIR3DP1 n=1 Tax=Vicugna pacos TaxID=30538 RepID=A0ABM5DVQ5_VICPA
MSHDTAPGSDHTDCYKARIWTLPNGVPPRALLLFLKPSPTAPRLTAAPRTWRSREPQGRHSTLNSEVFDVTKQRSFSVQRIWAQVGGHDKPSPSAWTSPVVPLGQHVTLQCHSHLGFDRFRLCKDAGGHVPNLQDVRFQNSLLVGPVTSAHAGTYRCLGYYSRSPSARSALSDPLTNVVTGVYRKPSLIAQPGPLVQSGRNGTLQCRSEITFDSFILILHREGGTTDPLHFVRQLHDGGSQANFSVGTMTSVCAGTYRCLCSLSHSHYEWSAPSDPLDMAITGLCRKPPLPAQMGPMVRSSGNLTSFGRSKSSLDVYNLFREGESHGCWLAAGHSHNGTCQAEFPLGPGSPVHSTTYSCHGLSSHSPYRWSDPSDPLYLSVTGEAPSACPTPVL